MNVSGVVVVCRAEDLDDVASQVDALGWAEVHYRGPDGRLVVTIEAPGTPESVERMQRIQGLRGVVTAEMAEYVVDTQVR